MLAEGLAARGSAQNQSRTFPLHVPSGININHHGKDIRNFMKGIGKKEMTL